MHLVIFGMYWTPFVLVVLVVVMLIAYKYWIRVLLIFVAIYISGFVVFSMILSHEYEKECSPNQQDIAVMKPMAQKIADYIVANGIPKSLADIQGLPYVVEGCEKPLKNFEKCLFFVDNKKYSLELERFIPDWDMRIYSDITETHLRYKFKKVNQQWKLKKMSVYSSKTSGICQPARP